jgi:hypothetical protein
LSTASLEARFGVTVPPWEQGVGLLLDSLTESRAN